MGGVFARCRSISTQTSEGQRRGAGSIRFIWRIRVGKRAAEERVFKMKALLVIDMQVGLFEGTPRHDAEGVVRRVNEIARNMRATGGAVIFIQHEDEGGFQRGTRGWEILPTLEREEADLRVDKKACDAFYETDLAEVLEGRGI